MTTVRTLCAAGSGSPGPAAPDHHWLRSTYRRIAYDFHIPDTRSDFLGELDAERTAATLADAGVQSLQLCAKSYWGLSLHPTAVGKQHPLLHGRDYFGEVLEALNRKGCKSLAYIIDFWDNYAGTSHPEWRVVSLAERNGSVVDDADQKVLTLCPLSGYEDYLRRQNEEVARRYPVAGIFNDMVGLLGFCYCENCARQYRDEIGHDLPETEDWADPRWRQLIDWRYRTTERLLGERRQRLRAIDPQLVYGYDYFGSPFHHYGLSHDPVRAHVHADFMTTETTPWDRGFGLRGSSFGAKLARDLEDGKPYEAVGARCATSHDFTEKSETEMMLDGYSTVAHNCPHVIIESASMLGLPIERGFGLIGKVFNRIRDLEPWLAGSSPVRYAALHYSRLSADAYSTTDKTRVMTELCGLYKACIEGHYPVTFSFDPTLRPDFLAGHDLLILADSAVLTPDQVEMIKAFVAAGGGLIATGLASGLDPDGSPADNFLLAEVFGCDRCGAPSDDISWMRRRTGTGPPNLQASLGDAAVLFQQRPSYVPVTARDQAVVLAERYDVPFPQPRGRLHSSHFEPPYHPTGEPLMIANRYGEGRCVYVAARIGTAYAEAGYHHLRRCLHDAMDWAARRPPPLTTDAPMSVEILLNTQPGRRVLHLFNFTVRAPFPTSVMDFPGAGLGPIRKSWMAYDEIIPLHDLHIRIPADVPPRRVYSVPDGQDIPIRTVGGEVELTVPRLADAATICLE